MNYKGRGKDTCMWAGKEGKVSGVGFRILSVSKLRMHTHTPKMPPELKRLHYSKSLTCAEFLNPKHKPSKHYHFSPYFIGGHTEAHGKLGNLSRTAARKCFQS